jgi:hypothetical protein
MSIENENGNFAKPMLPANFLELPIYKRQLRGLGFFF